MSQKIRFYSISYMISLLLLCSCDVHTGNSAQNRLHLEPTSYRQLIDTFADWGYSWETLDQGVPAFTLDRFPRDMGHIHDVKQKKKLFFLSLLPMIIMQNEAILQQRATLKKLLGSSAPLTTGQQQWLTLLCHEYRCDGDPISDPQVARQLLTRVDMLPTALVLAQAANESAYGSSRFAQQANNIFGQWTFTPGTGIVPAGRPEGATYEVRKFSNLAASIRSYMNNLNSHQAYRSLREKRYALRQAGAPLEGKKLAEGLLNYSTRRDAYVDEIQTMIRHNRLAQLAALKLRDDVQVAQESLLPQHQFSSRRPTTTQAKLLF
nr:glucosaminidase domain-containing protein [uncultured Desulfuromonas sp.]